MRPFNQAMRRSTTAAMLLAFVLPAVIRAADDRGGGGYLPPTEQTLQEEAARKAYEEAMAAQMARLRAQRPATSGRVPPAPINPEGDLAPEQPAPKTMDEVAQRRAERAARAQFTAEQIQALADRPERQPDHIRNARSDDLRLVRARLIESHREAERARRANPNRPGQRTELEEVEALRREIDRQTGNTHTVPPAPTEPPATEEGNH